MNPSGSGYARDGRDWVQFGVAWKKEYVLITITFNSLGCVWLTVAISIYPKDSLGFK